VRTCVQRNEDLSFSVPLLFCWSKANSHLTVYSCDLNNHLQTVRPAQVFGATFAKKSYNSRIDEMLDSQLHDFSSTFDLHRTERTNLTPARLETRTNLLVKCRTHHYLSTKLHAAGTREVMSCARLTSLINRSTFMPLRVMPEMKKADGKCFTRTSDALVHVLNFLLFWFDSSFDAVFTEAKPSDNNSSSSSAMPRCTMFSWLYHLLLWQSLVIPTKLTQYLGAGLHSSMTTDTFKCKHLVVSNAEISSRKRRFSNGSTLHKGKSF